MSLSAIDDLEALISDHDLEGAVERAKDASDLPRWERFKSEFLTADTELVNERVWQPNEAERERGVDLWFQTGANSGQGIRVEIGSMATGILFAREGQNHSQLNRIIDVRDVFGYNVQDGVGSNFGHTIAGQPVNNLLDAIDAALSIATRQRSYLGAVQVRLEHTIDNLGETSLNISSALSRIRDADMATESAQQAQHNVIQQAALAMLAQANQQPFQLLQLLQG